ncbi:MAG: hypothetical protein Q7T33_08515 [Dehalococcoidia bacterium]|nr:hypothetical protein [Dehalococcoidia bacterium]
MKKANLIGKWSRALPPAGRDTVRQLCHAAERNGIALYLVGGPVRDLLLGLPSLDADIAVEGDLAALLAGLPGLRTVRHARFLTATVRGDGFTLDLATARSETYQRPGALPTVTPAAIRKDLLRRDFTINAMALALTGEHRGELTDPSGGERDLNARRLRVLHDASFRDDATRILRAARYEARLACSIEPRTSKLLQRDLPYLDSISAARIHHEISRTLWEIEPERILLRLQELGALRAVYPAWSFSAAQAQAFQTLRHLRSPALHAAYWPLLAWEASIRDSGLARRLALTRTQAQCIAAVPHLRAIEPDLAERPLSAGRVCEMLAPHPLPAAWALAAITTLALTRERCLDYLLRLRHVRTALRGDDVLALGVSPGPPVGDALRQLKVAKLNGEVKSRRDEEQFVSRLLTP